MHRITGLILGLLIFFLGVAPNANASWYYSAYPRYGYSWYGPGWYNGQYYGYGGYWYYEQPVYITQYVDRYIPVVFSGYQPQALQTYQTAQLTTVSTLQRTQAVQQAQGVQQVQQQAVAGQETHYNCTEQVKAMDARLKALEGILGAALRQQTAPAEPVQAPQVAPKQPAQAHQQKAPQSARDGLAVLNLKCAICHDGANASKEIDLNGKKVKKGGGLVFFDGGKLVSLSDKQLREFTKQILTQKMPKDGTLENGEAALILQYLDSIEGVEPKKKDE